MIQDLLNEKRLLPLYTVSSVEEALAVGHCLIEAGLPVIEVAFRSDLAIEGIQALKQIPGLMVGAGTIKTRDELKQAIAAHVDFVVSPGTLGTVVDDCLNASIPVYPGVVTPSEILSSYAKGIRCFKFFPASSYGGCATLKALQGPFPDITFLPTGGVDASNYREYLSLPNVEAVGGSFLLPAKLIKEKNWSGLIQHIQALL